MRKVLIVGVAVLVAGGLFLFLRPKHDSNSATTTQATTTGATTTTPVVPQPPQPPPVAQIRIVVRGGKPVGGIKNVTVARGRRVVLVVTSDVADELHLHGYDLKRDLTPGQTTRLPFKATIAGTVEAELESRGLPLVRITTKQ